ncbi:MAG: hypothetical protein GXY86_04750 [Firmicutes bacterium]|nr:hypothetical protein [Bacillota bacterium]
MSGNIGKMEDLKVYHKTILIDHTSEKHRNKFIVNWKLDDSLNFAPKAESIDSAAPLNAEDIINYSDKIISHYQKIYGSNIVFVFKGVGVMLYKDLDIVIKALKERNCKTAIDSVFLRKAYFYEQLNKGNLDYLSLYYKLSNNDFKPFLAMLQNLRQSIHIRLNINISSIEFDLLKVLMDEIMANDDQVSVSLSHDGNRDKNELNDLQLSLFHEMKESLIKRDQRLNLTENWYCGLMRCYNTEGQIGDYLPEEYVREEKNHWKGWLCWAGLEQIFITHNGNVFRSSCCQDWIGNLHDYIEFPTLPVFCNKESCYMYWNITVKKQYPVYFQPKDIVSLARIGLFQPL